MAHAHAQRQFWAVKTAGLFISPIALEHFKIDKKRYVHLEMGNLKQTELQRLKTELQ